MTSNEIMKLFFLIEIQKNKKKIK